MPSLFRFLLIFALHLFSRIIAATLTTQPSDAQLALLAPDDCLQTPLLGHPPP